MLIKRIVYLDEYVNLWISLFIMETVLNLTQAAEMHIHGELQFGEFIGIYEDLEICCELEFFYNDSIFTIKP